MTFLLSLSLFRRDGNKLYLPAVGQLITLTVKDKPRCFWRKTKRPDIAAHKEESKKKKDKQPLVLEGRILCFPCPRLFIVVWRAHPSLICN